MRKIVLILFCLICFVCCEISFSQFEQNKLDSALSLALKCMKLTRDDLSLRNDYVEVDSFRLSIIDSLMKDNLKMISTAEDLGQSFQDSFNIHQVIFHGLRFLDLKAESVYAYPNGNVAPPKDTVVFGAKDSQLFKFFAHLSLYGSFMFGKPNEEDLKEVLPEIYLWMEIQNASTKSALGVDSVSIIIGGREKDKKFKKLMKNYQTNFFAKVNPIKEKVLPIILEDVNDEFKSVEELDFSQKSEEGLSKELIPLASAIDYHKLYASVPYIVVCAESLTTLAKHPDSIKLPKKSKKGDIIWSQKTPMGEFIIGGKGNSHYTGSPALIIDLGGDDIYELSYDSTVSTQVIIDLGGDDTYKALTDFCLGSGFFGTGILIDEEGDDTYLGKNFCLGSGLFGVGILIDKKGKDKYFGDTFIQGAGAWGIGILADLDGADNYNGALFAQGFGGVAGFGSLIEKAGNDNYFAGGKYKDILRYKEHYLSLSQGFSYGIRPYMSGGVGLLLDYAGNDGYVADIFGQGSSYWWGWGCLYDKEGNDFYQAFQYAQGSATHMTLGTLIDGAGDDIYSSKGVSQGCGHDWACGILLDNSGNDNYYANDLSQGAGNANGIGIIIDQAGYDGYYVKSKTNTQGYGNPRREYGSIGIFIDMLGKDKYDGNGCDSCWWSIDSKWGVGLDLEMKTDPSP